MTANTYGRQVVVSLTNKSGSGVIAGDVVVVGTANNDAFTTTTSAAFTGTVGIAQETIADSATGRVLLSGYAALVNTTASVTRQNFGTTSTTAKKAVDAGASRIAGTFCQFLTGGTTPDAIVWPADIAGGGSGTVTTVKDEGTNLSTAVVSLDFVGAGVTATGTTAVTVTIPGGGGALVLLEQHTASNSAQLDFTTFISSTYDDYEFHIIGLIPATNDVNLLMRMGTGGGPTYDTGANYGWSEFISRAGATAVQGVEGGATSILLAGYTALISNSTSWGIAGHVTLADPQSATAYKQIYGKVAWYYGDGNLRVLSEIHGSYESATAVTAIRFYMSSGNIASGTIRVYGVAKT